MPIDLVLYEVRIVCPNQYPSRTTMSRVGQPVLKAKVLSACYKEADSKGTLVGPLLNDFDSLVRLRKRSEDVYDGLDVFPYQHR